MVEEGEDEGRLGPEGDLGNPEALGQGGRPHEVGVGDEHVEGGITAAGGGELHHQLLDVGGHEVEKGVGEVVERLLVCGGGLETAVADEFVADVEAPGASAAEDVGAGAAGIEELAVEGFRGDDEAPGGEQDGEVSGGREVALEGVRKLLVSAVAPDGSSSRNITRFVEELSRDLWEKKIRS